MRGHFINIFTVLAWLQLKIAPVSDDSKVGPNLLAQVRFMDTLAVQLRYDWLGEDASLWTFGLSYSFF